MKNIFCSSKMILAAFCLLHNTGLFAQNPNELRINLKGACYEKTKGEDSIHVINDLNQAVKILIGTEELDIPKEGLHLSYQKDELGNILLPSGRKLVSMQAVGNVGAKIKLGEDFLEKCAAPGKQPQKPNAKQQKDVAKSNIYRFIPDEKMLADFRNAPSGKNAGCRGVPKPNVSGSAIVYNYQDQCICYFKDNQLIEGKKPRLRPRIDEDLHFMAVGYHPYLDSVIIKTKFIQRNWEYGEQFFSLLEKGKLLAPDTTKVKPDEGKDASLPDETVVPNATKNDSLKIANTLAAFQREMHAFYTDQRDNPTLTLDFLSSCVRYIKQQIAHEFGIELVSPENVLQQGENWIEEMPEGSDKAALKAQLEAGIADYKRLLEYNIIRFDPLQIKESDITRVTFEWTRNGKKRLSEGRTYDYFNKGGFKIDFSAGLIGHGLVDHRFVTSPTRAFDTVFVKGSLTEIDTITETMKGRVIREKGSDFNIGFGILSHYYSRWLSPRFNFSLTGGLLTETRNEELRIKYLGGISLLFGSEQRLVLTGGCVFGKVARLAEGLSENVSLLDIPVGQTIAVQTREIYQHDWFIGVTYNFGGIRRKSSSL